ncbi:FAD-binding oxidoreductase [Candidatus Woesearchaeota archaeon]|nr:FAD-binding oxidoreductase [Candidatus Woesearchaeota archaeon]
MELMKWWGWGSEKKEYGLKKNKKLLSYIQDVLGLDLREYPKKTFENITLPDITVSKKIIDELKLLTNASTEKHDRLTHSMGKGYKDLVRIRNGDIRQAPDVVAYPETVEEVEKLLNYAKEKKLKIIPFGGGTSVVGGVETTCPGTICADMKKLDKVMSIDTVSQTAHVQAGILGPDLEEKLTKAGFTLSHFPQSFEYSTLGGWIATRAAGQNSTKYGKIEDMVEALTMHYPGGKISTKTVPASASGSDIKQLLIGSEGLFGIITDAVIRLHPLPEHKHYSGFILKNFDEGITTLREILQNEITPAVARLSDSEETRAMMKIGSSDKGIVNGLMKDAFKFYLKKRGYSGDEVCMLILGFEGPKDKVRFDFETAKKIVRGAYLGTSPGKQWLKNRFELPYLRDDLLDLGILVDTLESATNWSNIPCLYAKTKQSMEDSIKSYGVKGFVQTHISHVYREGASLYYTFVAKEVKGKEIEQWTEIKKAATDTIISNGGTLSHHHGVGKDHAAWIEHEHGKKGVEIIKKLKECFDPDKVLNPGKMGI